MMNSIEISNLGKKYRLGNVFDPTLTFRELLALIPKKVSGAKTSKNSNEFWALRDINLEVKQGEVLGVIGRNGAGKSTLLKVLARITSPTTGQAKLYGKVASLLEVGTGFHPELSGRENIFLNGSILGLSKREIYAKFDEIVDFSGVEKFLETPVKRYSSGMHVRLAFSIAAHLEPDILLVDEVLAVGDARFREKCIGKMQSVAHEGRTVLFVSHNMAAVQSLCTRAVLLENGSIISDGTVDEVTQSYLLSVKQLSQQSLLERKDRTAGESLRYKSIDFMDAQSGEILNIIDSGRSLDIRLNLENSSDTIDDVTLSVVFFNIYGSFMFACQSDAIGKNFSMAKGSNSAVCHIGKFPLKQGNYFYNLIAYQGNKILDWVREAGTVSVVDGDYYGTGKIPAANYSGVLIDYDWE
jgi:homopolymeric O-antigen transport system ATP-binding protein